MIEAIKCYICRRSGVDLFWINALSEFMCWHCISAAVVVLARETAPSNNGVRPTAEMAGCEGFIAQSEEERQPAAADA
jgi:hypothetical protein